MKIIFIIFIIFLYSFNTFAQVDSSIITEESKLLEKLGFHTISEQPKDTFWINDNLWYNYSLDEVTCGIIISEFAYEKILLWNEQNNRKDILASAFEFSKGKYSKETIANLREILNNAITQMNQSGKNNLLPLIICNVSYTVLGNTLSDEQNWTKILPATSKYYQKHFSLKLFENSFTNNNALLSKVKLKFNNTLNMELYPGETLDVNLEEVGLYNIEAELFYNDNSSYTTTFQLLISDELENGSWDGEEN